MKIRKRVNKRKSRKSFNKKANRTHVKNARAVPMRGGFRL